MAEPLPHYQVVARRFRPRSFGQIVGQGPILEALGRALDSGRIPHALLFTGSRGVGKTTLARIVARALNCVRGPSRDPCGQCAACLSILDGSNPDVVEMDAASHNLVDDIRALRERVGFAALGSRYKVYILDEAHMLTRSAFNAFLKTLEEPPPNVVFILATTEPHKIPETIRSRCQVHQFRRVGEADIANRLRDICAQEGVPVAAGILAEIARTCRGGMRDAETQLECILPLAEQLGAGLDLDRYRQVTHGAGPAQLLEVVGALVRGEAGMALRGAAVVAEAGSDEREVLGEICELLRAMLLLAVDGAATPLVAGDENLRPRLVELQQSCDVTRIDAMIQACLLGRERLRRTDDRRLALELALVRAARAGSLRSLSDLLAAVERGGEPSRPQRAAAAPPPAPPAVVPPTAGPPAPVTPAPTAPARDLRSALLAELKQQMPAMCATIEQCDVEGPDARGAVKLRLRDDRKLFRDRLASDAVRADLQRIVARLAGREVTLVLQAPAVTPPAEEGPRPVPPAKAPASEAVRRLVRRFDGDLIDAEET
jgi:DNA polymerase-3 subunit gamma/tau